MLSPLRPGTPGTHGVLEGVPCSHGRKPLMHAGLRVSEHMEHVEHVHLNYSYKK